MCAGFVPPRQLTTLSLPKAHEGAPLPLPPNGETSAPVPRHVGSRERHGAGPPPLPPKSTRHQPAASRSNGAWPLLTRLLVKHMQSTDTKRSPTASVCSSPISRASRMLASMDLRLPSSSPALSCSAPRLPYSSTLAASEGASLMAFLRSAQRAGHLHGSQWGCGFQPPVCKKVRHREVFECAHVQAGSASWP